MEDARKHFRSGQYQDTDFRVEIWTGSDHAMVRSIQIGQSPPMPYSDGELTADSADAAFALAEAVVKTQVDQIQAQEQDQDDAPEEA